MARRTVQEFSGTPLDLVYIAGNSMDAEKAERALTEQGIDYALSLEPFMKSSALGTVFGGTYAGVFFFVPAGQHGLCRNLLKEQGLADTVSPDEMLENTDGA